MSHPLSGAFNGLANALAIMLILCISFVPLGVWKAVELVIYLVHHISIHWH